MAVGVLANAVINIVGNVSGMRGAMREAQTQLWGLLTMSNRMGGMIARNIITPLTARAGMQAIAEAQQRGLLAYNLAAQQHRQARPPRPVMPSQALLLANPAAHAAAMQQYLLDMAAFPGRMAAWRQSRPNRQQIMDQNVHGAGLDAGRMAFVLSGILGVGRAFVEAARYASDFTEELNKMNMTFGQSTKGVMADIQKLSMSGVGRSALMSGVSTMGIEMLSSGMSEKIASQLAMQMGQRAIDVSSLYNISQESAINKFKSGLAGFGRPLKDLGIILTEDRVEVQAFVSGLWDGRTALTEEMKVRARANLILDESARAAGDYAKTLGEFSNQYRAWSGNFSNLMETLGNTAPIVAFTMAVNGVLVKLREGIEWFSKFRRGSPILSPEVLAGFGPNPAQDALNLKFASIENRKQQDRAYADQVIKEYHLDNRRSASHMGLADFGKKLQEQVFNDTGKQQLDLMRELVGLQAKEIELMKQFGFKNFKMAPTVTK